MTNPFLTFLSKLQADMAPIEAAALSETEQIGFAALQAVVTSLVTKLVPGATPATA